MGPRLFGIRARSAGTVAILRRGPRRWSRVYRWDPAARVVEPGSWLHGTLYPQRCDLSPDGRWLAYFALKGNSRWEIGATYLAISRLPWLTALAAWSTCGTWTRGLHFSEDRGRLDAGPPDTGDIGPMLVRYGLAGTAPATFAVERRSGWIETPDTPLRTADDAWDERRAAEVTMARVSPTRPDARLFVSGRYAAFRDNAPAWGRPRYVLATDADARELDGVQWADWGADGSLLVATTGGTLEIRDPERPDTAVWHEGLAAHEPDPEPPPPEAGRWS